MTILGSIFQLAIFAGVIYFLYTRFRRRYKGLDIIRSRWHCSLPEFQFSAQEFYSLVEAAVKKTEVKGIGIDRAEYEEKHVLLARREYLRLTRGEYVFLICAAPFGTGFFVSWWLGETVSFVKHLILKIPWLARLVYRKTFFQMDTETMFQECVRKCVLEVVEHISTNKGIRGLSERERIPIDMLIPRAR